MKALSEQADFYSGVRGPNVYQLTTRRQLVTGPSNSLDVVILQRFVNPSSPYRIRAYLATLHLTASGDYELLIPASGTKAAERIRIHFDTKPALVGGVHGSWQGPAQYSLQRDSSGWRAKIEVNETLHRRDVPFIIGHELDEIAIIIYLNPADHATRKAEARASLLKPGSTSTYVTAHDRAAARELCALWDDYEHPPPRTNAAGIQKRRDRLFRMFNACGLTEPVHIFDKLRLLRAEGAKDWLLREIGVPGERQSYLTSAKFLSLQARFPSLVTSGSIVDEGFISHLMIPVDPGRRAFSQDGINGGHDEAMLHEFVNSHSQIVIVKEAEKVAKGVVYRKYSQYRWDGSGPKPTPHDPRFPKPGDGAAGTYHSDWILAKQRGVPLPKTTFSSRQDFLLAVDEAWLRWVSANPLLAHKKMILFTYFSSEAGIQVTGFVQRDAFGNFQLQTAYVEASWF